MALLNMFNDLFNDNRRPILPELYDQHFGLGLVNDEILRPMSSLMMTPFRSGYLRPWRNLDAIASGVSAIHSNENELKINLDVQQFRPNELKVQIVDGYIVIEGKHEERSDEHGFISRQFTRRYKVPEDVDQASISSSLSSDGVLSLIAPRKDLTQSEWRGIPITQTNLPAVKSNDKVPVETKS